MKLLLDNQPIDITESNDLTVRVIIDRLSDELKLKNRVISTIVLDGREMGGWDDPELLTRKISECNQLKIQSDDPRNLAHKVLYDLAEYMPRIQQALIETSAKIQSRKEDEGMQLLHQVSSTWAELYQGLQFCVMVTGIDSNSIVVEGKTFTQLNGELHDLLEQISDLVEEQQFLELSDILEYELAARIPLVEEAIYQIIKEVEKKPH